jgi:hypothetical protein
MQNGENQNNNDFKIKKISNKLDTLKEGLKNTQARLKELPQEKREKEKELSKLSVLVNNFKKERNLLLRKKSGFERELSILNNKEGDLKAEKKKTEEAEKKELTPGKKRIIEKRRWEIEERRRKIEERKWQGEDELKKIVAKIREIENKVTGEIKTEKRNLSSRIEKINLLIEKERNKDAFYQQEILRLEKEQREVLRIEKIAQQERANLEAKKQKEESIRRKIEEDLKRREERLNKSKGEEEKKVQLTKEEGVVVEKIKENAKEKLNRDALMNIWNQEGKREKKEGLQHEAEDILKIVEEEDSGSEKQEESVVVEEKREKEKIVDYDNIKEYSKELEKFYQKAKNLFEDSDFSGAVDVLEDLLLKLNEPEEAHSATGDTLSLKMSSPAEDPTEIYLDDGAIMISKSGNISRLTTESVVVTSLSFSEFLEDAVRVSVSFEFYNPSERKEYEIERDFKFTENVRK